MSNQRNVTHNLDINMYSFKDILNLFNLNDTFNIEDLGRAKKKVLMLHPDKSKLSSEYFIFYKKAYEIIYHFFEEKIKQQNSVPHNEIEYSAMNESKQMKNQMTNIIQKMKNNEFQDKFNRLFEENMQNKIDESKNDWFKDENPQYNISNSNNSKANIGAKFNELKEQNKIVKHSEIRGLGQGGTNLYEEDNDEYIDCDPFSKLKFDDLRKVHKDQTIFAVSENDINNVKTYNSVDHLKNDRYQQNLNPLEKTESEKIIELRRKEQEEIIRNKQIIIRSSRTYEELKTFTWNTGRAQAKRGFNDDLVMSLAIGVWLYDASSDYNKSSKDLNSAMLKAMSSRHTTYSGQYMSKNNNIVESSIQYKNNVDKENKKEVTRGVDKHKGVPGQFLWVLK